MTALSDMQLPTLTAMAPELYLCISAMMLLMFGVYNQQRASKAMLWIGVIILAGALYLVQFKGGEAMLAMNGMFSTNGFTVFAKSLVLVAGALALMLSAAWLEGRPYEYIVLVLFSILGMLLMISANDFLALYMGLEMSSLALYVLASFDRDNSKSTEAGLKYFVLGALASGMVLFGISLVYGFAGSTGFETLASQLPAGSEASKGVIIGMVLIIVGLCFKVSAVPFHMWAPDVYEGAPTPVTAFFATAPKIAAMALFARVMLVPFGTMVDAWQPVMILVSMASMMGGALAAMMQTNIKRLLAYSSISHAGFILMGLAADSSPGLEAMLIYLALYIFMSAGAFGCVLHMNRGGKPVEEIKDLAGLSQTQPLLAGMIAVFMFSMAGIPPLAGFFGKFYVILAALHSGLYALAIVGLIASVIGCYYYIKVVKVLYFDEPAPGFDKQSPFMLRAAVAIGALVTLWFFVLPSPLVASAARAAETILK
jgi:NADH-quinone oxidoreductase subunit N